MLFGCEHVAQADSHNGAATQFGLGEIRASARVDLVHNLTVQHVDLVRRSAEEAETDYAHTYGRRQLKALVDLDPVGKKFGETHMFANASGHPGAAEAPENHPCFQGAEPAP